MAKSKEAIPGMNINEAARVTGEEAFGKLLVVPVERKQESKTRPSKGVKRRGKKKEIPL